MTNTEARWGFATPVLPTLPVEHMDDFFRNAPYGTVVEVDGELSKRSFSRWIQVEEIEGYDEWREHARSTDAEMIRWCETREVTVLKVGDESSA